MKRHMIRIYLREETFTGRETKEFGDPDKLEKYWEPAKKGHMAP